MFADLQMEKLWNYMIKVLSLDLDLQMEKRKNYTIKVLSLNLDLPIIFQTLGDKNYLNIFQ